MSADSHRSVAVRATDTGSDGQTGRDRLCTIEFSEIPHFMRYLYYLNCAMMALSAVLTVVLAVVCLIYVLYLGREPQLQDELRFLFVTTGLFGVMAVGGVIAVLGQHRSRPWHWAGLGLWVGALTLALRLFAPA